MTQDRQAGRWLQLIKESFGQSFWIFVLVALFMAGLCYLFLGPEVFAGAVERDREMLASLLPKVAAAQVVAGMIWVLLPRDRMSELLNKSRGRRGLVIASVAGMITPGGPASAYPFLAILAGTGADRGILVAYITSWALLGLQRVIVWDVPIMGMEFSLLRFAVCIPLPFIAGMLARRLPFDMSLLPDPPTGGSGK